VARYAASRLLPAAVLAAIAAWSLPASADLSPRANYMIHCQGCHLSDGHGREPDVPSLALLGRFTALDAGRRYLTQVPGASQAPISDRELAAVLNWVLVTYSAAALPPDFIGYTEEEVARSRHNRPLDILVTRRSVLAALEDAKASARR
jgi:mono/diheme cytochrome c family protein